MNCGICCERFRATEDGTPRIFPCGHCYCSKCIVSLLKYCPTRHRCPECRNLIGSDNVQYFPKNYKLLDIIRRQKKKQHQTNQKTHEAVRTMVMSVKLDWSVLWSSGVRV